MIEQYEWDKWHIHLSRREDFAKLRNIFNAAIGAGAPIPEDGLAFGDNKWYYRIPLAPDGIITIFLITAEDVTYAKMLLC
jgi:hypothetical protein